MNVSLVILALTVASFLLGFLRDLFIARSFGLSWEADLIFVALILPLFFENFLGLALRDAMIPYLQKLRSQSQSLFEAVARWLYWRIMLLGGAACLLALQQLVLARDGQPRQRRAAGDGRRVHSGQDAGKRGGCLLGMCHLGGQRGQQGGLALGRIAGFQGVVKRAHAMGSYAVVMNEISLVRLSIKRE